MRKTYLIILLISLLSTSYAQENTGAIQGKVLNQTDGEPLTGVSIQVQGSSQGAVTDIQGNFQISNLNSGLQTLIFSFVGYRRYTTTVQVIAGRTSNLGNVSLEEDNIGLDEIEVFANIVDAKRQAPTPISTITAQEIEERLGAQEFPEILKSTPGVFVNTVGGSFGDAQVRIRGFGSENTAVLINGIPVNDMENGRVFWSNWGGLNDVTRNQQVQRGLGVTKLAVSAVGGTINIITKPTEQRKGVRLTYSRANRSWEDRVMLTASTGLMKGDWAVTVSGSTRQGDGFREGTDVNAWAYFVSAYKGIGKNHQLVFTAFGAPQTTSRGRSATLEVYNLVGDKRFNPSWGTLNGEFLTSNENNYHKPKMMLNHYWDIKDNITLSTSVYYSLGRGGGTSINRTADAEITQPVRSFFDPQLEDPSEYQVPWDEMVAENQANFVSLLRQNPETGILEPVEGARSNYIIQESRNDHNWFGALSTLNADISEDFSITAGLDYRWYRGFHYQTLDNLLGGDFWIDKERFNLQPFNNLLEPRNTPKREGDRIGYDYDGTVIWGGAFLQGEYTIKNVDLFLTGNFVRSSFQREGNFLHEEFLETSLGESETFTFNNFTVKAGANYRITGRHNVFANAGFFTRAPFFRDAFVDNRVSNIVRGDLDDEEIFSLEGGYGYRSARLAVNINLYRTSWQNRAYTVGFFSETYNDFVNFRMSDVGAIHQGIEIDFTAKLTTTLTLEGMASIGDWTWDGNANAIVLSDPGLQVLDNTVTDNPSDVDPQTVFIDGLEVGGAAQTLSALTLKYRNPKFWYVGASGNYYDRLYQDFNPETRTSEEAFFNRVEKLPSAFTFDVWGGKSWKFGDVILYLRASINNITDNQFIIDSNQRTPTQLSPDPSPFVQYYFGRTYYLSATINIR